MRHPCRLAYVRPYRYPIAPSGLPSSVPEMLEQALFGCLQSASPSVMEVPKSPLEAELEYHLFSSPTEDHLQLESFSLKLVSVSIWSSWTCRPPARLYSEGASKLAMDASHIFSRPAIGTPDGSLPSVRKVESYPFHWLNVKMGHSKRSGEADRPCPRCSHNISSPGLAHDNLDVFDSDAAFRKAVTLLRMSNVPFLSAQNMPMPANSVLTFLRIISA